MSALDTLAARWDALQPSITRYGQPGRGPLVLLFHGCGGVRGHLQDYAEAAVQAGAEAVIVDSYAPRGWSPAFAMAFVCTGMMLHGRERAGDVLAAAWGLLDRGQSDRQLILAGWSHGAWSIMDLMTMPLDRAGEAGLDDPTPSPLRRLEGLFLAYPYGGLGALSRVRPWVRGAEVLAVAPHWDHVTNLHDARRLYEAPQAAGWPVELWENAGTHSYDEAGGVFPMRHDEGLTRQSVERFEGFVRRLAVGAAASPS